MAGKSRTSFAAQRTLLERSAAAWTKLAENFNSMAAR